MRTWARVCAVATVLVISAGNASAGFDAFVIRNGGSNTAPGILTNNVYTPGATEFVISESGMKAGWGSNDINGFSIGDITDLSITRHDDVTRFTAGSGPAVAPYFNIWVTDGNNNYAVLANEPSNPSFQSLFTPIAHDSHTDHSYSLSFADLENEVVKVYETIGAGSNTDWVHALFGSGTLTFGDVASLMIAPPPVSYIAGGNGVGPGAPDVLGTNVAYGFNWVFGDTLSNYVSGAEGYVVSGASVSAVAPVPVPAAAPLVLLGMSIVGLVSRRSRKRS